jgi:hypothetical protein
LGLEAGRYAAPARDAMHRAARRAYLLHALEQAAAHASRALALCGVETDRMERMRIELLAGEIAFYTDGDAFIDGGGTEKLTDLAERMFEGGDQACAARAWTLLGQAAWVRADRVAAMSCLDKAVELFDELPDTPEKAEAYFELGRLHFLNVETAPAVAAATAAAEIADRLGVAELRAHAQITIGSARYEAGDRTGLAELRAAYEMCRNERLLALTRAARNLSWALREEGDWPASKAIIAAHEPVVPGGHTLATDYSDAVQTAWFDGDWDALLRAADELLATPSSGWDVQARAVGIWVGMLREMPAGGTGQAPSAADEPDEIDALIQSGVRSGFHRLQWTVLAHGALCRALQGRTGDAETLLMELVSSWRDVRAMASGEWIDAAALSAALVGRGPAVTIRDMLADVPHRTPWVEGALRTVTGAAAFADGDFARAADMHLAAAEIYGEIPNQTDRMMAMALAVHAMSHGAPTVEPVREELAEFATRCRVPGLLLLTER